MFEIILISHGPLSKAMLETAQMIVGEQEHVTCFELYLGDSVDLFRKGWRKRFGISWKRATCSY